MAASARTSVLEVCARAGVFLALWLILAGVKTADLPAAAAAVAAAVWTSLRLMPPGVLRLSPVATAHLASRFPQETLVAGIDVARRALAPRLSLRPGFITYPSLQPPGPAREAFLMLASLLPGTIPCDAIGNRDVLVHGVDVTRPIAAQIVEDEARFMRAIRGAMHDG